MIITKDNLSTFSWPDVNLTMEDSESITKELNALNLALFKGEISALEYNQKASSLMSRIERNSLNFGKDHDLFKSFLLSLYKDKSKALESAEHEKQHADFLIQNGLTEYSFRLKLFTNGKVQPYTHYVKTLPKKASKAHAQFHKDFVSAPKGDLSDSDLSSARDCSAVV